MSTSDLVGVIVAALGGAAVGLERQWSGHADGPSARFGGIRTFAMLGAIGGLAGWLSTAGASALGAVLLAGAAAIVVAGYVAASRHEIDGTTEVAALVVLVAGVVAGLDLLRVASGIFALEVLLLVEKSRLHALVHRIDDVELRAGVRFGVMALVVLPLLPAGPYGPWAVRPQQLWILVLFFSGLSFVGHVLHRMLGPSRGYLASGAVGGVISSTNVTLTFARWSRSQPALGRQLAFGAVAANAVLFVRVTAAVAALNASMIPAILSLLAAPAATAMAAAAIGLRTPPDHPAAAPVAARNPLQLAAALQMAALFQVVLVIVHLARDRWGQAGILTTAAALGLTDVDALTVSMTRDVAAASSPAAAALAIAVGICANSTLKLALALIFGSRTFRVIAGGALVAILIAAVASIVWLA